MHFMPAALEPRIALTLARFGGKRNGSVVKYLCMASTIVMGQLVVSAAVAGSCVEPAAFNDAVPSGATATREAMLSAQRAIKAYDIAVKAFLDCLHDAGDGDTRGNAAVQKLDALAARFNTELKLFKARNGAS